MVSSSPVSQPTLQTEGFDPTGPQILMRLEVNDCQQAEPATAKQGVRDKIHAPCVVWPKLLGLLLIFQCRFIAARSFLQKQQALLTA